MGNAQWNLNTIAGIRTLDWTHVTALPIGAKQATGGRKLAAGGLEPLFRRERAAEALAKPPY
jgi:hypothetical protein